MEVTVFDCRFCIFYLPIKITTKVREYCGVSDPLALIVPALVRTALADKYTIIRAARDLDKWAAESRLLDRLEGSYFAVSSSKNLNQHMSV